MPIITACSQDCPDTCSLVVETSSSGRVHINGNPDHPFTAGFCCAKMKSWHRRLSSPHRITAPLLRDGAGWREIGWEEALEICAARIQELRTEPLSILHLDSSGNMGLMVQVPQHFFNRLGASRAVGSLCAGAGMAACQADFGRVEHHAPGDLLKARMIVNWGRDIGRTSIHLSALIKQARKQGTRLLTISPGGDGHEAWCDEFIRVRPARDRFLAAAVCRTLIENGHIITDPDAVTANWPAFREIVMARPAAELAKACGTGTAEVKRLADIYGSGEPVATLIGWGLQRHVYGAENVRFINALALLAGQIGRSGGGSYYIAPSTRHLDLSWQAKPTAKQVDRFFKPTIGRDILSAEPAVKMIWANGTNPVNQSPDSHLVSRAFRSVPFKVVVDAFMTDTAELADLILPCTLNLEQENLNPSYFHDFINYARPAFTAPAGARSDHWILTEAGRRLNPPIHIPPMEELMAASLPPAAGDVEELADEATCRSGGPLYRLRACVSPTRTGAIDSRRRCILSRPRRRASRCGCSLLSAWKRPTPRCCPKTTPVRPRSTRTRMALPGPALTGQSRSFWFRNWGGSKFNWRSCPGCIRMWWSIAAATGSSREEGSIN